MRFSLTPSAEKKEKHEASEDARKKQRKFIPLMCGKLKVNVGMNTFRIFGRGAVVVFTLTSHVLR